MIYGLLISIPEQEKLINKHCTGDCGKLSVGGIDGGQLGPMAVCHEKECPYEKGVMNEPVGKVKGENVYLRALGDDDG